jgi:hypothetical protein
MFVQDEKYMFEVLIEEVDVEVEEQDKQQVDLVHEKSLDHHDQFRENVHQVNEVFQYQLT